MSTAAAKRTHQHVRLEATDPRIYAWRLAKRQGAEVDFDGQPHVLIAWTEILRPNSRELVVEVELAPAGEAVRASQPQPARLAKLTSRQLPSARPRSLPRRLATVTLGADDDRQPSWREAAATGRLVEHEEGDYRICDWSDITGGEARAVLEFVPVPDWLLE